MQRRGISVSEYLGPNADGQETSIDVVAVIAAGRVGIQVTELDPGREPGQSRGKKAAREAECLSGGVYGTWGQSVTANT